MDWLAMLHVCGLNPQILLALNFHIGKKQPYNDDIEPDKIPLHPEI
jgi:hypothetical protein